MKKILSVVFVFLLTFTFAFGAFQAEREINFFEKASLFIYCGFIDCSSDAGLKKQDNVEEKELVKKQKKHTEDVYNGLS